MFTDDRKKWDVLKNKLCTGMQRACRQMHVFEPSTINAPFLERPPPLPFWGELVLGVIMQDYKNIKLMKVCLLQFPTKWCITLLDPTDQDVPCSPVYVQRTENMRGVEKDSLSSKYQFPG